MTSTGTRHETQTPSLQTRSDEWEIDRLDLDAYLRRIGYDGPLAPTVDALHVLHRAHAGAIPFENLDIIMGRGISLSLDDIQDKLVRRPRGGYCFEQNLLFAAALEHAGFEVRRLAARVAPDRPGTRTHMALTVTIGGRDWLADVGFGASLLAPVPLEDDVVVRQGDWTNAMRCAGEGAWRLRSLEADGWRDLYEFTLEPQRAPDYRVYNHYTSTHPASHFVSQVTAIRITPDARFTLRDRTLSVTRPGGAPEAREVVDGDVAALLRETFGIDLTPDEITLVLDPPSERPARS